MAKPKGAKTPRKSAPKRKKTPKVEILPPESEESPEGAEEEFEEPVSAEAGGDDPEDWLEAASDLPVATDGDGAMSQPPTRGAQGKAGLPARTDDPDLPATAISPNDPLRRYMDEVQRYPLLEPEEEYRLAVKLRDEGDMDAAKRLVSANLRLVVKIAFEYRSMYSNVLDLIQEGNVGLMKAVSKFDPNKGARLGYYASWWIRSYILKYLLDNFRLVRVGTTQAQKKLFYHLMREQQRLEAQGLLAGPKLLAERLDVREKDVIEMQQRLSGSGAELSLDAPIDGDENRATHMEFLADGGEGTDDRLAREQLLRVLRDELPHFQQTLNEKELKILRDRILAEDPKTLQEVADLYGLTRERVRQIEAKVIAKLRKFLTPSIDVEDET